MKRLVPFLALVTVACSSSETSQPSPDEAAFPLIGVTSPFARTQATGRLASPSSQPGVGSVSFALDEEVTDYEYITTYVQSVLDGDVAVVDAFDVGLFMTMGHDASCYGPMLAYADHPDGDPVFVDPESGYGALPTGDLGMWLETDSETGDACAVAELGERLRAVRDQTLAAMVAMACLKVTAESSADGLPAAGDTVDLTDEMNAVGITDVTFSSASIALNTSGTWTYSAEFAYGDATLGVTLDHTEADEDSYEGTLGYWVSSSSFGTSGNCGDEPRTLNGSLSYVLDGGTSVAFQSRVASFCGKEATGFIADASDPAYGQVDLTQMYDPVEGTEGWGDNASVFVAEFDPTTLDGQYLYAWQAGNHDSNTRLFHVGLNGDTSDGEAWFGFGLPMAELDGTVEGFYCSWAGPGSNPGEHTIHQRAQRQFVSLNGEVWEAVSSEIGYAPTDSCEYDGSGSFVYDTNLDGDLGDETTAAVSATLADTDYGSTVYDTIAEVIEQRVAIPDVSNVGGWPGE